MSSAAPTTAPTPAPSNAPAPAAASSSSSRSRSDARPSSSHSRPHSSSKSSSSHKPSSSSSHSKSKSSSHSHSHSHSAPKSRLAKGIQSVIPSVDAGDGTAAKKAKSAFLCDVEYWNTLPPPPFDPKLQKFHFSLDRLVSYHTSEIEKNRKLDYLVDNHLGIPLDLIDTQKYVRPQGAQHGFAALDDADKALIILDEKRGMTIPTQEQLFKQGSSNWMKRPEYTHNNLYDSGNKQVALSDIKHLEVEKVQQLRRQLDSLKDNEISVIEATFDKAKEKPVHPTNKLLQPVKILEIFPMPEDLADLPFERLEFDFDPYTGNESHLSEHAEKGILSVQDVLLKEYDAKHHGFYIKQSGDKERDDGELDEDGLVDSFDWQREYETIPAPKVSEENNFFFLDSAGGSNVIYYGQYVNRMKLCKRIPKQSNKNEMNEIRKRPKTVHVKWRNEEEIEEEKARQAEEEKAREEAAAEKARKEEEERRRARLAAEDGAEDEAEEEEEPMKFEDREEEEY